MLFLRSIFQLYIIWLKGPSRRPVSGTDLVLIPLNSLLMCLQGAQGEVLLSPQIFLVGLSRNSSIPIGIQTPK